VLSSSVSSEESEINADSNDDAVDGEHVVLYLCREYMFNIIPEPN